MTSGTSSRPVSPLRARMIEDMTVRGFKEDTRRDYVREARRGGVCHCLKETRRHHDRGTALCRKRRDQAADVTHVRQPLRDRWRQPGIRPKLLQRSSKRSYARRDSTCKSSRGGPYAAQGQG